MPDSITKSENMNSPGDYVIVVELVHIFPYKLVIFPQPESMNMNLRASSKDISLSTCLLQFILCENLYCYGVDSVMLLVGKVNCYGLVAVIWEVLQFYGLELGFVADVADVSSPEFEELGILAFLAL